MPQDVGSAEPVPDVRAAASRTDVGRDLARALAVLGPLRDILENRVDDAAPPAWCEERGWTTFLTGLDDRELERCEAEGLPACVDLLARAPASLATLALEVSEAVHLPTCRAGELTLSRSSLHAVPLRKRLQLEALLGAVRPMAERACRIVDVGAGHGHFTRIAAGIFDKEALGLERVASRVAAASALASVAQGATGASVATSVVGTTGAIGARFIEFDACREELVFAPDDLAVGLHACGDVGDRMIVAAGRAGCDLALVSCCLQKVAATSRAPLSRMAAEAGMTLRREMLGLTNLAARARGVETSLVATMEARRARHALAGLLRGRGIPIAPGEEMRGINRRQARAGLGPIAARALAIRGLAPPTDAEIRDHDAASHRQFALIRRLSLPRSMLARLTEVAVVLDRAVALQERGHHVVAAILLDAAATPRNIALFASPSSARLPALSALSALSAL